MIEIEKDLNIYFPLDLKPRKQQIEMLEMTKKSINNGKKFILLNAAVGCGKSYYTVMFMNWYKNYCNSNDTKFDIITNSKILQEQYKKDFDFINDLRGQSNYKCIRHNTDCHSGKELNKALKQAPCGFCPYDDDKQKWIEGDISLTNFHLYNSFAFYVEGLMDSRASNVLIVDEAHSYEEVFCDFISVKLSSRILKNYGMEEAMIDRYDSKFNNIKTVGQFINFLNNDFMQYITKLREEFEISLIDVTEPKIKEIYARYIVYIDSAEERFNGFLNDYEKNEDNWALDITKDKNGNIELIMQPIWGNVYLDERIFERYDHVIFMSGTILNKEIFSMINGLDNELSDYYEIDSNFPVENRQIYFIDCGKMNYDSKRKTFEKQLPVIKKILKKYENEKGIIHTTNYEISNWLKENIKDKRLIFHDSSDREEMLSKHIKNKKASVIVSPSMSHGLDLKDELSRFQIILKMPFPNLGSNKIKSRKESKPESYSIKTCQDLIQSYGRSIRSVDDHADTFILDSNFKDLMRYSRKYFPKYFLEAVKNLK